MKVALLTPCYESSWRGNAVTVRRIEHHLQSIGITVAVFSMENLSPVAVAAGVRSFAPDLLHAFHAVRCGVLAGSIAAADHIPYIITLTGTDIYCPDRNAGKSVAALRGAASLVFFSVAVRESLLAVHPELSGSAHVISQGVVMPDGCTDEPADDVCFRFLLPAGVRAVKNLLFPLMPLARLHRSYPQIRLDLAGGVIETDYAARLESALAGNPFARWLGEIPGELMTDLYDASHVVINCSLSEGGMSNSLLEGMAHCRPLLAADIEGNRGLVRDGENGFLYRDAGDFASKAKLLLLDKELRKKMGRAGRQFVGSRCSPAREAESYLQLYLAAVADRKTVSRILP